MERQRPHYKHYIGLTSQINFCQVPLRLDSFNQCSFSCSYCFAKSRGGYRGERGLQVARAGSLDKRFRRISNGLIASAVDEFLNRRIPIQLGGMTDPLSSFERRSGTTLEVLRVLAREKYPTLISTKSADFLDERYIDLLQQGNFLVRFSISVVRPSDRSKIERGTPSPAALFKVIRTLAATGINCAVRFQPIIPGHEQFAFDLLRRAKTAGAKHITTEYLKLPFDDLDAGICKLSDASSSTLLDLFRRGNATVQGRELVLPASYKAGFLSEVGRSAHELGLTIGYGDNEFLPYSDGRSCCNGADLYLDNFNLFESNSASLVRRKRRQEPIRFDDLLAEWIPRSKINTYLNSRVRIQSNGGDFEWRSYLAHHWRAGAIYSPDYFHGVRFAGEFDARSMPIFVRDQDRL